MPTGSPAARTMTGYTAPSRFTNYTRVRGAGMPMEWASWLQAAGLPELEPAATLSFSGYHEAITAAHSSAS